MNQETIITGAQIVTPDDVITGSVKIVNGLIESIDPGVCSAAGAEDLEGDLLIPGLIEMHTDGIERHLNPRPGVI